MTSGQAVAVLLDGFAAEWPAQRPSFRRDGDASWRVYVTTLRDLVATGSEAVPALLDALTDDNRQVRALAARALGFLAPEVAVPALAERLARDDWPTVRVLAADALGLIQVDAARQALLQVQPLVGEEDREDRDLQLHIDTALRRATGVDPRALADLLAIEDESIASALPGQAAPTFTLPDAIGKEVGPHDYRDRVVALMFVYGDG